MVRVISAFRDRSIALADVTRARWRCRPAGGSVVLHAPGCRVVIEFASYDGWRELVAYFRQSLPQAVQENYEVFEGRFIVRLVRRLPIVFSEGMTLKLSVASLIVAAAYWAMWDFQWTRMVSWYPLTFCPAIAVMAALDCVRRRRRLGFLAMLVALAAVAFLFAALWPTIRPLVKGG